MLVLTTYYFLLFGGWVIVSTRFFGRNGDPCTHLIWLNYCGEKTKTALFKCLIHSLLILHKISGERSTQNTFQVFDFSVMSGLFFFKHAQPRFSIKLLQILYLFKVFIMGPYEWNWAMPVIEKLHKQRRAVYTSALLTSDLITRTKTQLISGGNVCVCVHMFTSDLHCGLLKKRLELKNSLLLLKYCFILQNTK